MFTGIQTCEPSVRLYLLQHPETRIPAQDVAAAIRAEFPDSEVSISLDLDPDDAERSIVFRAVVPGLTLDQRIAFYGIAERTVPQALGGRIVLTVDRG